MPFTSYGLLGAAVCRRCGKPFGRRWWAPNVLVGKLQRCPHCGAWSIVRRATPEELARAESFLRPHTVTDAAVEGPSTDAGLLDELERSRFIEWDGR